MRSPGCANYNNRQNTGGAAAGRTGRASNLQDGLRQLRLNTLLSLIESADLVEALSGNSDLTLFAPTDAALKTFIDGLPDAPDTATVKKVLLNHVISGKVESRTAPTLDDVINPFELGKLQEGLKGLRLTTLNSLLESANLVDALSSDSELTLFAPTDDALARFINSLPSAPDAATVKTVLLNHVIPGKAMAADISDGLTVKNLDGNDMTFRANNRGVTIGAAKIDLARTDIPVLKVTVHVLDDVINPANLPGRR